MHWRRLVKNIKVATKILDGTKGGNKLLIKWINDRLFSIIGGTFTGWPPKSNAYE